MYYVRKNLPEKGGVVQNYGREVPEGRVSLGVDAGVVVVFGDTV